MADNKSSGGLPGDENKKVAGQNVENGKNGKIPAAVNDKPNTARLNAKRRRQRRKFSDALKVEKKPQESVRSRDDVSPRPAFVGDLRRRETQKVADGNQNLRPKKMEEKPVKPVEQPVKAVEPDKQVEPSTKRIEPSEPAARPSEPIVPDVPAEPPKAESLPEPDKDAEHEEPQGITYFSHPFSDPDDQVSPDDQAEPEPQVVSDEDVRPDSEERSMPEEKPVVEEQPVAEERPVPESRPADSEEDIIIGKEETNIPIPVGRINEETEEERHEELPEVKVKEVVRDESIDTVKKEELAKDREEHLEEKASSGKVLKSWLLMVWPKVKSGAGSFLGGAGKNLGGLFSQLNVGRVMSCLALTVLLGGGVYAYTQKLHEKAYSYVAGLITPKQVEKVEVKVDAHDQRMFGITTASIFGNNAGSSNDLVPSQILVTSHFGMLMEPKVQGETGITALTYYGALKDGADTINQFVVYLENLEEVQNLYKTDVYAMLDRSTARDRMLLDYLEQLKRVREKSLVLQTQIRINIDDFTKSFGSLTPDKSKYEQDFFAAMESLQPEKSDLLLKGFIDITQKQAALKARVSALERIEGYYESALDRLDKRILAVEQNRDALIQGIRVVDIPGSDLNIIIKSGQN